jgi:hypothetical protein
MPFDPTEMLALALQTHELSTRRIDEQISIAGHNAIFSAELFRNEEWHPSLIQLDVRVTAPFNSFADPDRSSGNVP